MKLTYAKKIFIANKMIVDAIDSFPNKKEAIYQLNQLLINMQTSEENLDSSMMFNHKATIQRNSR